MKNYRFVKYTDIEFISITNEVIRFNEHCHSDCFVVTLIIDGNIILTKDNKSINLAKGDSFDIVPYENHSIISENNASILSICVKKQVLNMNLKEYNSTVNIHLSEIALPKEFTLKIKAMLHNLYEAYHTKKYTNNSLGIEVIEKSPEADVSLDQLCAISYTSKYHYIRSFKKATGVTPHNFIILRRIRKAQKLLDNGGSVTDAAISTGFYDQSHLDKYFKRIVGISPDEYSRSVVIKCK